MFVRHRLVAGVVVAALLAGVPATSLAQAVSLTGARNLKAVRLLGAQRGMLSGQLFIPNTCYTTQFQSGPPTVFPPSFYLVQKVFQSRPGRMCGMVARWVPTMRSIPAPAALRWITVRTATGTVRIPVR